MKSKQLFRGALAVLLLSGTASASTTRFSAFDLWPAVGERYFFSVSSSETLDRRQFSLDLSNIYAWRPIDLRNAAGVRVRSVVDYYLAQVLSGSFGITDRWQVGLTLPIFSLARFETPIDPSPGPETVSKAGDLRLVSRVSLWKAAPWGLAVEPFVTLPLGADENYLGDAGATGGAKVIGDFQMTDRLRLATDLGFELRRDYVTISNINFGHRFLSNVGLVGDVGHRLTVSAEVQANSAFDHFFSDKNSTPIEFLGGVRWGINETGLQLGAGGGSCLVCGVKGAVARGFLTLSYRRQLSRSERPLTRRPSESQPALDQGRPVGMLEPVYFGYGQVTVDREGVAVLKRLVENLRLHPEITVLEVIGHSDKKGRSRSNDKVSLRRARAVVSALRKLGVPERVDLIPLAVGAREPVASNRTEEGRRRNRRVIFRLP